MSLSLLVGMGGRRGGELRGTSPGGGVLGFDVVGALGSFQSPGGSGLGEDKVILQLRNLGLIYLVLSFQKDYRCPQSSNVIPTVI